MRANIFSRVLFCLFPFWTQSLRFLFFPNCSRFLLKFTEETVSLEPDHSLQLVEVFCE